MSFLWGTRAARRAANTSLVCGIVLTLLLPLHPDRTEKHHCCQYFTDEQTDVPRGQLQGGTVTRPAGSTHSAAPLPVDHPGPVQVLHGGDELPDVPAGLSLVQPLLLIDLVHEVTPGAQLHDQVVAVLRLQNIQELGDVRVADHLLNLSLPPQVFGDIRVLFGSLFVDDFDGHLRRNQEHGC